MVNSSHNAPNRCDGVTVYAALRPLLALVLLLSFHVNGAEPDAGYTPDPNLERLIDEAAKFSPADKKPVQEAIDKLAAQGDSAQKALEWHLKKETSLQARLRYAELLARACPGKPGYRTILELRPDGTGNVTLWSDRALLADCGKQYARLMGQPEPVFNDEALRANPFGKAELLKCISDEASLKFLEAHVEPHGAAMEATGLLSIRNFDAFTDFAEHFDVGGYQMLFGSTLTDASNGVRALRFKKAVEQDPQHQKDFLLLFHGVRWEYVLELNGKLISSNAHKSDGKRLIWSFNIADMLNGNALIEARFEAGSEAPRPTQVAQAQNNGTPVAIPARKLILAKAYKGPPLTAVDLREKGKEMRDQGYIVELDGRESLPHGEPLQYQWVQTGGTELPLPVDKLATPRLAFVVRVPGEFRFELTVSLKGVSSKPVEVKLQVEDDNTSTTATTTATTTTTPAAPKETATKPPETSTTATAPKPPEKVATAPAPVTPAPVAPVASPADATVLHEEGIKLFKAGNLSEAKLKLLKCWNLNPRDLNYQFDLAVVQMELGEIAEALPRFEAIATARNDAASLMNIGHCYARAGSLMQAAPWYRRGTQVGKEKVQWEPTWQLGNKYLSEKDYSAALASLKDAETAATKAKVEDYRLHRDLAITYHALMQNGDALKHLNAMQQLGYTPDAKLLAEVKGGATSVATVPPKTEKPEKKDLTTAKTTEIADASNPNVSDVKPSNTQTAKTPTPPVSTPAKTDPPAVKPPPVEVKPAPVKPVETKLVETKPAETKPVETKPVETKPVETKPVETKVVESKPVTPPPPIKKEDPPPAKPETKTGADVVDVSKVALPPETTKKEVPKAVETKTPPAVQPADPPKTVVALEHKPAHKPKTQKVAAPKKPLPPVPADFETALAAGTRAYENGVRFTEQKTDDANQKAGECWDEAEAMLRGAWAQKPSDERVVKAFQDLSKYVGAIALVHSPVIKAKVRGLVVLDAEASVVPKDRPLYCVWVLVSGEDENLNLANEDSRLRPETMTQKKIGLRITRPGTYKFELAVSDGKSGGNPVTVTVEVAE